MRNHDSWCSHQNQERGRPDAYLQKKLSRGNLRILRHEHRRTEHPRLHLQDWPRHLEEHQDLPASSYVCCQSNFHIKCYFWQETLHFFRTLSQTWTCSTPNMPPFSHGSKRRPHWLWERSRCTRALQSVTVSWVDLFFLYIKLKYDGRMDSTSVFSAPAARPLAHRTGGTPTNTSAQQCSCRHTDGSSTPVTTMQKNVSTVCTIPSLLSSATPSWTAPRLAQK